MAGALEGVLGRVPGLAGYLGGQQVDQEQQMGQLQQVGALQNILAQAQSAPLKQQLLQQQVAKAKQEQEMNAIMSVAGQMTPDQLDALGQKLALGGHPGAATVMSIADKRRAATAQAAALQGMQSRPAVPQATPADPTDPTAAPTAPATPAQPGVADFLTKSPYVGEAAKNLQMLIDRGAPGMTPQAVQSHLDRLTQMHTTQAGMAARQDAGQANKIEIRNMFPPQGAATETKGDFSKTGDDFLKSLPAEDQSIVKKLANYEINPQALSTKGGHREKMLSLAAQYNPDYDDTQYANKRRAITQFGSGPQGNTVRALNVAVEHIDTLGRAADALKNGSFTPGNLAYNEVAKIFGKTPPNTFEGIRDIVANEVVKGTIGATGALMDREKAAEKVRASSSPEQLKALMNGWTELMGGQVKGLEQQYEGATGLKDFQSRYLRQRTRDAIALSQSKAGGAAPSAATLTPQEQDELATLRKRFGR